jgi:hypothetical protein
MAAMTEILIGAWIGTTISVLILWPSPSPGRPPC